jgi:hypothetical protein
MLNLTGLYAAGMGISNITGLEYAHNLTALWLDKNNLSNISPLAGLTSLLELDLGGNQINDLTPLSGLTGLVTLDLGDNDIRNIDALSGLINLEMLTLNKNQISDISPLSGLTNLVELELTENRISDISSLSHMERLERLDLEYNPLALEAYCYYPIIESHNPGVEINPRPPEWLDCTVAANPSPMEGAMNVPRYVVLSWKPGIYADTHDVYIGTDKAAVTNAHRASHPNVDYYHVSDPSCDVGLLEYHQTYFWRVDEVNDTTIWQGDIWSFTVPPLYAFDPSPSDGARNVYFRDLSWKPGFGAQSYHVYFGTNRIDVENADTSDAADLYRGHQDDNRYAPPERLEFGRTYYWRIDGVEADLTTIQRGHTWRFTLAHDPAYLCDFANKHGMLIGTCTTSFPLIFEAEYQDTLIREFNILTHENEMKWEWIHPERDRYNFLWADAMVDFAETHGMVVHGHTLCWHSQNPDWLAQGNFSRNEMIDILRDHIHTVVGRYAGRVAVWD